MKLPSSFSEAFFVPARLLAPASRIISEAIPTKRAVGMCRCRTRGGAPSCLLFALQSDDDDEPSVDEIHASADAIFGMIDSDANGSISYSELQTHLIEVCGYTQDAVDSIYYALDADMDGSITRDELRMGFVRYKNLRDAPGMGMGRPDGDDMASIREDAVKIFDSIDTDDSGTIDDDELRNFLREKGYGDNAIDSIYSTLDVDRDGQITREELSDAFVRYSALRYATGSESSDDAQEFEL